LAPSPNNYYFPQNISLKSKDSTIRQLAFNTQDLESINKSRTICSIRMEGGKDHDDLSEHYTRISQRVTTHMNHFSHAAEINFHRIATWFYKCSCILRKLNQSLKLFDSLKKLEVHTFKDGGSTLITPFGAIFFLQTMHNVFFTSFRLILSVIMEYISFLFPYFYRLAGYLFWLFSSQQLVNRFIFTLYVNWKRELGVPFQCFFKSKYIEDPFNS
jgi:hypothetical protein